MIKALIDNFEILALVISIPAGAFSWWLAKRRSTAFTEPAGALGLGFEPEIEANLSKLLPDFEILQEGSHQTALNKMHGTYEGDNVTLFDFEAEDGFTDHAPPSLTVMITLITGASYPNAVVRRTPKKHAFKSRDLGQSFWVEDAKFQKEFIVKCKNADFVRGLLTKDLTDLLLSNKESIIELHNNLLLVAIKQIKPEQTKAALNFLLKVKAELPVGPHRSPSSRG